MKKLSKRLLSAFLAVVMVFTVMPFSALTAGADEARDRYLFAYFTGNTTEQQRIKFALSEDGDTYYAINKNDPVIKQNLGTGCARDPYIFRGQDGKYYAIATDMDASGGWWGNSNSFVLWRSNDLVTWTNETIIDVAAITGVDVHRAWAPQVIWDASEGKYMVYFGLAANGYSAGGTKMHYMYTADLLDQSAYSAPQPMMKNNATSSMDSIDGDITYYNGTYYMFYKDETQGGICIVTSDTAHGLYDTDNIVKLDAGSDIGALEGCQVWWKEAEGDNPAGYVLMADRYSANGVFACYDIGDDLDAFYAAVSSNNDISGYYNATMSSSISVLGPRHGSVLNINETEYNALKNAYGIATNEDIRYNFNSQNYVQENAWDYVAITDTSGYTYDVMTNSGQYSYSYTDEHYISLNGSTVFINDSAVRAMMTDTKWTASFDVSVMEQRGAPIFALTSGDNPASSIDWIRFTDNGSFYLYKDGAYKEIGSTTINTSVEYTFTITYDGTNIILYKDGVKVCEDAIGTLGFNNEGSTHYVAFGWTDTCGVTGVHGAYTNVRFRNKTLTASQVASETAIQSELLYQYNEGTETINGRINATAGGSAGVTTSMAGGRGASYTVAGWFNIGSSKEGSLFSLGWGGTDNSKQYLNLREDGIINYCWGDGSTQHYYDSSSIYTFAANTWYYIQINIIPDGNSVHFRTFVNGTSVNDQTTGYNNMTDHAYNPHAFFLQNTIDVRLGTSNVGWWNAASNTNFDDFRVYTKAIDPAVLYQKQQQQDAAEKVDDTEETVNAATLAEAMAIYESRIAKMAASGYTVMYTNLSAAYTAYKRAVKAPGTPDEGEALAALNKALTNMKPFVEVTANATPGEEDANYNPEAGYYSNVIYAEGGNSDGKHGFDSEISAEIYEKHGIGARYGSWAYLYYPATVLLYDGKTDPKVPVMLGFRNDDNRYDVEILDVGTDMTEFTLNTYWTGKKDSTTFIWPADSDNQFRSDGENWDADFGAGYGMNTFDSGTTDTYRIVKNSLTYTAVPTSAYTCYSSTTWNIRSAYNYVNDHWINDTITDAIPDIDVINYKKLTDALKAAANSATNKGYLADLVEKYQGGGLEGIFAAYDSATSLDPRTGSTYFNHTYEYNGADEDAMDAAALLCGNDIDASVVLLSDIKITTETANYERLCAAIEAYEAKMKAMTTPYTNLEAAYEAYVLAAEYKDAYEFGARETFTNPTLAIAAQQLEEATANMTSLNDVTFNGTAYFHSTAIPDSNADPVDSDANAGFNNILYCSITTKEVANNDYNAAAYKYLTPTIAVLVYDGKTTPSLPVGFTFKANSNGKNQSIYYCRMPNNNCPFELRGYWRGYNDFGKQYHFNTSGYDGTASGYRENYLYATSSYSRQTHSNTGTPRQFVNKMFYTGTGGTSTDKSNLDYYYQEINNIQFALCTSRNNNPNNAWKNDEGTLGKVYVINYKALTEVLESLPAFENGIDVKQYVEGGLKSDENNFKAWLAKIDTITGVDPTSYFNNMNDSQVPSKVTECANAIKAACDAAASLDTEVPAAQNANTKGDIYDANGALNPISENNGAYTNLKIALLEAAQATEQGCIINSAWNSFQTAIDNARAGMADIADANTANYTDKQGYNSTAYDADAINTLAKDLDTAYKALSDAANTAHPMKFSYREVGTHNMWFQCNNNNGHEVYHHGTVAETVVPADGTAYDMLQIVYNTLDPSKYNNFSTIQRGKTVFDAVKTNVFSTEGQQNKSETAKVQDIVDHGIATLLEAINTANAAEGIEEDPSVPNTYNITFNVYVMNADGTLNNEAVYSDTTTNDYGTTPTISVANYDGWDAATYQVQYWEIGGKRVNNHDESIVLNSQKDTEVNAVIMAIPTDLKLIIKNTADKEFYTINVTADTTIAIDENNVNTIILGGTDRRIVPDSLTYSISGWHVNYNAAVVTSFDEGTTVGDLIGTGTELVLKPEKSWKYSDASTVYSFTVDGTDVPDGDVPYDYHLRVNAAESGEAANSNWTYGGTVWGIVFANTDNDIFVPVTYDNTYRFYVNRGMDFYTLVKTDGTTGIDAGYYLPALNSSTEEGEYAPYKVTGDEMLFYLDAKLPLIYSYAEPTGTSGNQDNRWTTRSAFTAQVGGGSVGDVTITECGTLYTANGSFSSERKLTIENVGNANSVFNRVNGNRDKDSNQYSYSRTNGTGTAQVLYTRAYVKYSYTYEGAKIDAIAYGPVNICEFSAANTQ